MCRGVSRHRFTPAASARRTTVNGPGIWAARRASAVWEIRSRRCRRRSRGLLWALVALDEGAEAIRLRLVASVSWSRRQRVVEGGLVLTEPLAKSRDALVGAGDVGGSGTGSRRGRV